MLFYLVCIEDLTIKVDDGNDFQLEIIIKFTEDPSGEQNIDVDYGNDSLLIICINFSGKDAGLKWPAYIADVNGKKIYFIFSSSCFGYTEDKARSIKYTIFLEK